MLQEAVNRIHSDSIHCYKRQTIEYTLTVYSVTRADNRMHSDRIHCYKRQTIEYTLTVYNVTRGRQ